MNRSLGYSICVRKSMSIDRWLEGFQRVQGGVQDKTLVSRVLRLEYMGVCPTGLMERIPHSVVITPRGRTYVQARILSERLHAMKSIWARKCTSIDRQIIFSTTRFRCHYHGKQHTFRQNRAWKENAPCALWQHSTTCTLPSLDY